jgi:hypothetical protein
VIVGRKSEEILTHAEGKGHSLLSHAIEVTSQDHYLVLDREPLNTNFQTQNPDVTYQGILNMYLH